MNFRKLTARLRTNEIEKLGTARILATSVGRPLNTYVRFDPFADSQSPPRDAADAFVTLRKHIAMWVHRNCSPLVAIWFVTASDDGCRPQLHYFIHTPNDKLRAALSAALTANYPADGVVQVTTDAPFYPRPLTGPFIGRRSGMTRNIGQTAVIKHFTPRAETHHRATADLQRI